MNSIQYLLLSILTIHTAYGQSDPGHLSQPRNLDEKASQSLLLSVDFNFDGENIIMTMPDGSIETHPFHATPPAKKEIIVSYDGVSIPDESLTYPGLNSADFAKNYRGSDHFFSGRQIMMVGGGESGYLENNANQPQENQNTSDVAIQKKEITINYDGVSIPDHTLAYPGPHFSEFAKNYKGASDFFGIQHKNLIGPDGKECLAWLTFKSKSTGEVSHYDFTGFPIIADFINKVKAGEIESNIISSEIASKFACPAVIGGKK